MKKSRIPLYLTSGLALVVLFISISPPAFHSSEQMHAMRAQRAFREIEAVQEIEKLEKEQGYLADEREEELKRKHPENVKTLKNSLEALRISARRRDDSPVVYFITALGLVLVGALISQALVIRSLRCKMRSAGRGGPEG